MSKYVTSLNIFFEQTTFSLDWRELIFKFLATCSKGVNSIIKVWYYNLIKHNLNFNNNIIYAAAWLKQVPLKVLVFVWWLLCNRLPTKDNLLRRRVLQHDDTSCVGGCGLMEFADHLALYCEFFGNLWCCLFQWLGVSFITPDTVQDHFHHFGNLAGLPRSTFPFLKVIWHACIWVIWKERNHRIFNNKAEDLCKLLDNVKLMSFLWLRANKLTSAFSYHDWWWHPLLCLGVRE